MIAGEWKMNVHVVAKGRFLLALRDAFDIAVGRVVQENIEADPYNHDRLWAAGREKLETVRAKRDRARKQETRDALTEEVDRLAQAVEQLRESATTNRRAEEAHVYKALGGRVWPEGV